VRSLQQAQDRAEAHLEDVVQHAIAAQQRTAGASA
jgi:hypothetical protein